MQASFPVNSFFSEDVTRNRLFARIMPRRRCAMPGKLVERVHVLGGLGFRSFDLADADEDHEVELKALAALHGQDVDLGLPWIVSPLAAAVGHEQMGNELPWIAEN